ncbi:hypothetical protein [Desulfuromonas acetoxidans]|uniref:hypothetical protein n=1 Tax=Desulfuromonas acetoxidans TaxID=891 RepID=UPI002930B216|nr:hypothetical protein [Desulfuromonas acetoxidans]
MVIDKINQVIGVGVKERNELIRWYSRLNETERLDVHRLQTDLLRQKRIEMQSLEIDTRAYAALILALAKRRQTLTAAARKEHMTSEQAEQITKMRHDAVARHKGKGEGRIARLVRLRLFHEIENLRDVHGYSWRKIAVWIGVNHKTKVSHNQIRLCFDREKDNRRKQEDPPNV